MENMPKNSSEKNSEKISKKNEGSAIEKIKNSPSGKILILDDDISLCHMLRDTLQEYGFKTAYTDNCDAALEAMKEFKPEAALVDFNLGATTGLEAAQKIKEIDPDIPIILMTAYPSLDLVVEAIHNNLYDFISKPVDNTYLLRSVTKALEKRHLTLENKMLVESLKKSNEELQNLSQMKSKFLSFVTHDLRTPLTSILGYSEFLRTTPEMSETERNKCFDSIKQSAERMNHLIGDLMDNVSIEAGKLRVDLLPIDFSSVYKELKTSLAPLAENKKVNLSWEIVDGPMPISGDAERLIHVLNNLISNALKHTPENGHIIVRSNIGDSEDGKERLLLVEVSDTGDGISEEDHQHIFEQFYQVQNSPTRRQGLGLGLSISKEIIKAHNGTIGVYSDGIGKGCTFWFMLPILDRRTGQKR